MSKRRKALKNASAQSILFTLLFTTGLAHAQSATSTSPAQDNCCSKKQLEIMEQDEMERQKQDNVNSEQHRKDVLATGSDTELWRTFSIYSDAKDPEHLVAPIERKSGFHMALDPTTGKLSFLEGATKHTFQIGVPKNKKGNLCPIYSVRILDASPSFAFFQQLCLPFEYEPKKSTDSLKYFLYDMKTGGLQTMWFANGDQDTPPLEQNPPPRIKIIQNGYQWDWKAVIQGTKIVRHVKYQRKLNSKTGKLQFDCQDLIPIDSSVEYNETACDAPVQYSEP